MPARRLGILNHYVGAQPVKGLRVMRANINFYGAAANDVLILDATNDKMAAIFGTPQAIYVDNHAYAGILTIIPSGSDMPIYVPSNSVGMFPLTLSEKFRVSFSHSVAEANIDAWIFNSPQVPFVHLVV